MACTDRPTILIVEDEPANIHSLAQILQGTARLCFATSGAEALDIIQTLAVDLILLDILLPDTNGFELFPQLHDRGTDRQIPILFVTALCREEEEAQGLRLGALDYIKKPFNPVIVQARVSNLLRLSLAYRELEASSNSDFLTGAFNRRYLLKMAELERHRWRRHERPFSLLLFDIDHFKQVNDRFGHIAGDRALRHLVRLFQAQFRQEDIFARIGGEEFAALLPETDLSGARELAERLCHLLPRHPVLLDQQPVALQVSIGVAQVDGTLCPSIEQLLEQADRALYQAKRQGRNQVVVAARA
ncbi:GGDEF domain-containing response regulator [Desulfuromonas thiophila]|uniref:diguanylate cyclase n=1 Tax=Desulfuromonas thiophila TaxID=57664 RepID=A0A1G6YNV1_9BACT|nr:diguanylate cyclase [Desulfuromonas thiophila]SDD91216.1 diguanylate cyclase (GGDEF) domain-containing protein [Desulfuromonas thiophila]